MPLSAIAVCNSIGIVSVGVVARQRTAAGTKSCLLNDLLEAQAKAEANKDTPAWANDGHEAEVLEAGSQQAPRPVIKRSQGNLSKGLLAPGPIVVHNGARVMGRRRRRCSSMASPCR